MGRRNAAKEADTLEELGEVVGKAMASQANDAIVVSVGLDDSAVMPYVWIRRNADTDEWEGELGDCIKLGIEDGSLIESDPIQVLTLDQAVTRGIAEIAANDGVLKTVTIKNEPKPTKKRSNEEMIKEANRMVKDLFVSLKEQE